MMHSFAYFYRKASAFPRLIFGLVFLGFVLFWMTSAWSMLGIFSDSQGGLVENIFQQGGLFVLVPLFLLGLGLVVTVEALYRALTPLAVLSGDDQGLTIAGPWFKKHHFAWSELEYIRYEQKMRHHQSDDHLSTSSFVHEYLIAKPKMGRSVSVSIGQLDGSVDDIISDIRKLATNLEIKGFDK